MVDKKKIVMSVGGSLVAPVDYDQQWLQQFKQFILSLVDDYQFILVVGGGAPARRLQAEAKQKDPDISQDQLDWVGIKATKENAHHVQQYIGDQADLIENIDQLPALSKIITISGGWKPGWTTDYVAVHLANHYNIDTIINLSNIDYVYTDDPKTNPKAKPLENLSWTDLSGIVGDKHQPGMNTPFDPQASQLAEKNGKIVVMLNGHKFDNIKEYLAGGQFIGTIIA